MDIDTCEFCGQPLTDETRATCFGLTVCTDYDACLERQAGQGDLTALEVLAARKARQRKGTDGQRIDDL